ncbi:hypothetical protein ABD73_16030 [Brevibacillus laterosporus]|nr:hypothetical protein [Brevibacillus laterosporus]
MLRTNNKNVQMQYELVCLDELVPEGHLLRIIQRYIDFSFIIEKVRPYYCQDNGRPSIDPVMLFKMIFIGYLYGIRSERQLKREIQTNIAYRWFLGLSLSDRVPDHSTINWKRRNRFKDTPIFQDIFDEIVRLAIKHRMVGECVLITNSTHLKANSNKRKFVKQIVEKTPKEYLKDLEEAVSEDRAAHGKKN